MAFDSTPLFIAVNDTIPSVAKDSDFALAMPLGGIDAVLTMVLVNHIEKPENFNELIFER